MAERTTRKDVEAAFRRIMRAIGGDYNEADVYALGESAGGKWRGIVGRYGLDYAGSYGGYRIVRCMNEGGGESEVTRLRLSARAFYEAERFMTDIMAEKGRQA